VCRGAGQPGHGHREQHQVPGGLSHHPYPSSRLVQTRACSQGFHACRRRRDLHRTCDCCFAGLLCPDLIFTEACLRCLRTVFISPVTPVQLLYTVGCLKHALTAEHMRRNLTSTASADDESPLMTLVIYLNAIFV